jgi:antitoxin Phd
MRTNATEFKTNLGTYLQKAIMEPVIIEKNHRQMAVLMSIDEYERLSLMEDAYWEQRANEAGEDGFIGQSESLKYLKAGGRAETRS